MIAKVFLDPCPLCTPGKRCKGHASEEIQIQWTQFVQIRVPLKATSTPGGEVLV